MLCSWLQVHAHRGCGFTASIHWLALWRRFWDHEHRKRTQGSEKEELLFFVWFAAACLLPARSTKRQEVDQVQLHNVPALLQFGQDAKHILW